MLAQFAALHGVLLVGVEAIVVGITMFSTHALFEWTARRQHR